MNFRERLEELALSSERGIRETAMLGEMSAVYLAYKAGARAALELVADILEEDFGGWRDLRAADEARFPGAPCEAADGVCFAAEQLRRLAGEIAT